MGKVVALFNIAIYFFKNFFRFRLAHDNHYHITKFQRTYLILVIKSQSWIFLLCDPSKKSFWS